MCSLPPHTLPLLGEPGGRGSHCPWGRALGAAVISGAGVCPWAPAGASLLLPAGKETPPYAGREGALCCLRPPPALGSSSLSFILTHGPFQSLTHSRWPQGGRGTRSRCSWGRGLGPGPRRVLQSGQTPTRPRRRESQALGRILPVWTLSLQIPGCWFTSQKAVLEQSLSPLCFRQFFL